MEPLSFSARTVAGSARGRTLTVPTMNVRMEDVPSTLEEGVYCCIVTEESGEQKPATMHYGPRPVFQDTPSCEVHVINEVIDSAPESLTITVLGKLRNIQNFKTPELLVKQMKKDVQKAEELAGEYLKE